MGLFSRKKTISVSSVVYNLAGPEADRPDYLKSLVTNKVISGSKSSMSETINKGLLNGPGIRLRHLPRWAEVSGYNDLVGLSSGTIEVGNSIDDAVLAGAIPHAVDETVVLQSSEISRADFEYWAEQYVLENHPSLFGSAWVADYLEAAGEIKIVYEDLSVETFTPVSFDPLAQYLYASYNLTKPGTVGPVETGDVIFLGSGVAFPDISGWTQESLVETPSTLSLMTLVETTVTYSDARPEEYSSSVSYNTASYTESHGEWSQQTYMGQAATGNRTYSIKEIQYQDVTGSEVVGSYDESSTDETIAGGVIKTTTVSTTITELELTRSYRTDTQEIVHKEWLPLQYLIYKYQDGQPELDAFFSLSDNMGTFFPFIPVRLNNQFISDNFLPAVYEGARKALKKATGTKLDALIEKVADNESLGDIDYAYAVFGVSLNVEEHACRKYLYRFFKTLLEAQPVPDALGDWEIAMEAAITSNTAWNQWKEAQWDASNLLFGSPEPVLLPYPPLPNYSVHVTSGAMPVMNYDMLIQWAGIKEETGLGLKKVGAKYGDLWFEIGITDSYEMFSYGADDQLVPVAPITVEHVTLYWQETNNSWKSLKLSGLKHRNMIYGGKSVDITAKEALADADESGFIIPLHDEIYRSMSLVDSTQMSTACCFMVFNCYTVTKQKWYQTILFKIIVFLVQVKLYGLVSALTTAAVTVVIEKVAVAIFGDKLGGIIAAAVNIAIANSPDGLTNTDMATIFGNMMKAENLIKLSMAVGDGVAGYLRDSAMEKVQETQTMLEAYADKMAYIDKLFEENIGYGRGILDPTMLTNSIGRMTPETMDNFLNRTLMTGSEIAELSMNMIDRFPEMTTSTNLPT